TGIVAQNMLYEILSGADANRVVCTLRKLGRHCAQRWVLTGGLAVEVHLLQRGRKASIRKLGDIDFITETFDGIPESLADDFMFRHIHPFDPPDKTLLQAVDVESALRIDVFRAYGAILNRSSELIFPTGVVRIISLEDLIARLARLALNLAAQIETPAKHALDFLRLMELVDPKAVEAAWRDHRKPAHPATFRETSGLLHEVIATRSDLLITPDYSKDTTTVCSRCVNTGRFRLADPSAILAVLGYR
ncbi:MAG: hypothetical protein J2P21_13730, partial [Chloracidobacterium sp.]|nr:hypothetical protein [Chloracidobacterium sp.]